MATTRRGFLVGGIAAAFAESPAPGAAQAIGAAGPLITSAPVLMNPAERTVDVVFAVSGEASGWVEISKSEDMSGSVRVYSGDGPVMRVDGRFAVVRIKGLRPATRYWYRIGADRIELEKEYKPRNRGGESGGRTYSFTTSGAEAVGSFCAIQDTHSKADTVGRVLAKIAVLEPSVIVWNGDARNFYRTAGDAVGTFLKPHPGHLEYAAGTPVAFLNGNHDYRGRFALHLEDLVPFRDAAERGVRHAALGQREGGRGRT